MDISNKSPDIFLSYASRRRPAAAHFARVLECYGYSVWYDYLLLEGKGYGAQLDAIVRSSKLVVVLWCSLSVQSEFVREEFELAKALDRLFPIKMEPCELLVGTRMVQYADLSAWEGSGLCENFAQVAHAIGARLKTAARIDEAKLLTTEREWRREGARSYSAFPIKEGSRKGDGGRENILGAAPTPKTTKDPFVSAADVPRSMFSLISAGALTVGCYPYPPLMNGIEPHSMSGPWIELVSALAERLGLSLSLSLTCYSDMLNHSYSSVDVMLGVFETERRRVFFDFTRPINRIGLSGICLNALTEVDEKSLRDGGYKVAVQDGEVGWEFAQDEMPRAVQRKKVTSIDTVDGAEVLGLVESARNDIALMDLLSCVNFLRGPGTSKPIRLAFEGALDMFDCCVAIRKTSGLSKEKISEIVYAIRNESWYLDAELRALRGYEGIIRRTSLR